MNRQYPQYLIDTNILRYFYDGNQAVTYHWNQVPKDRLWISIITLGETFKGLVDGALKFQEKNNEERIQGLYHRIHERYVNNLRNLQICDYTPAAREIMQTMPQTVKSSDRRIAAIALDYGFIVVTSDKRDFAQLLPETQIVDWTMWPSNIE